MSNPQPWFDLGEEKTTENVNAIQNIIDKTGQIWKLDFGHKIEVIFLGCHQITILSQEHKTMGHFQRYNL